MNSLLVYFSNNQKRCRYFVVTHRDKWQQHTYWMSSKNHVLAKPKNSSPTLERAFGLSFIFFLLCDAFSRKIFLLLLDKCNMHMLQLMNVYTSNSFVRRRRRRQEDIFHSAWFAYDTDWKNNKQTHYSNISKEFKATR